MSHVAIPELSAMCKKLQTDYETGKITLAEFDKEICYVSLQDKCLEDLRCRPMPTPVGRKLCEYLVLKTYAERRAFRKEHPSLFLGPKNSHWLSECGRIEALNDANKRYLEFMLKTLAEDKKACAKIQAMLNGYPGSGSYTGAADADVAKALEMFDGTIVVGEEE